MITRLLHACPSASSMALTLASPGTPSKSMWNAHDESANFGGLLWMRDMLMSCFQNRRNTSSRLPGLSEISNATLVLLPTTPESNSDACSAAVEGNENERLPEPPPRQQRRHERERHSDTSMSPSIAYRGTVGHSCSCQPRSQRDSTARTMRCTDRAHAPQLLTPRDGQKQFRCCWSHLAAKGWSVIGRRENASGQTWL